MGKRIITLGTWNNKPIEWIVLKEESFGILITTKYSFGQTTFSASNKSKWSDSDVRIFLNSDFWNKAFSVVERINIINVYLNDVNTKDNIFLISREESDNFLSSAEVSGRGYWCVRTSYNDNNIVRYSNGWGWNSASVSYETYPSLYIRKEVK